MLSEPQNRTGQGSQAGIKTPDPGPQTPDPGPQALVRLVFMSWDKDQSLFFLPFDLWYWSLHSGQSLCLRRWRADTPREIIQYFNAIFPLDLSHCFVQYRVFLISNKQGQDWKWKTFLSGKGGERRRVVNTEERRSVLCGPSTSFIKDTVMHQKDCLCSVLLCPDPASPAKALLLSQYDYDFLLHFLSLSLVWGWRSCSCRCPTL